MRTLATTLITVLLASAHTAMAAEPGPGPQVNLGAVLDGRYQDGERGFSEVEEGFGLGHTEITLDANIDDKFRGVLTTVLESHDGDVEVELEEAFVETLGLAGGLNLRAGRMLSQFGYLNSRHLHEDDFSDRPAAYRAFLGDHYFDDGAGASLVLPVDHYLKLGFEAFDGDKLASEGVGDEDLDTVNVLVSQLKTGGDLDASNSWQLGLGWLHNRNGAAAASFDLHDGEDDDHEHEDEHAHEDDHGGHAHGPAATGDNLYGIDVTWKWAPNGNYRERNLALTAEYLLLDDLVDRTLAQVEGAPGDLSGWYLSLAWQFAPQWTAAVRYGEVETFHGHDIDAHDGHIEGQYDVDELEELDVSLAWHPSHYSTVRANYTRQTEHIHGASDNENIVVLQYVMSLGAHGAHRY